MVRRLGVVLAIAFLLGCSGGDSEPAPPGGSGAGEQVSQPEAVQEAAEATGTEEGSVGFPARAMERVKDSLSTGAPLLDEDMLIKAFTTDALVAKATREVMDAITARAANVPPLNETIEEVVKKAGYENKAAFDEVLNRALAAYRNFNMLLDLEALIESTSKDRMAAAIIEPQIQPLAQQLKTDGFTRADFELMFKLWDRIQAIRQGE